MCSLAKAKQSTAEIELQLSQRRFIVEAIQAAASLLQVPIITAGVWYLISKDNLTLSTLNKAMIAAELSPIIGDIKYPEGVLLGASIDSLEDFLGLLKKSKIELPDLPSPADLAEVAIAPVEYFLRKAYFEPIQALTTAQYGYELPSAPEDPRSPLAQAAKRNLAKAGRQQENYDEYLALYKSGLTPDQALDEVIIGMGMELYYQFPPGWQLKQVANA